MEAIRDAIILMSKIPPHTAQDERLSIVAEHYRVCPPVWYKRPREARQLLV